MSDETYYTVLGVPRSATPAQIKAAYRELVRQVHPDALPSASDYWKRVAEERTKDINEAYTVLSDPKKRRLYDQQLDSYHQSQSAQAQPGNGSQTQQGAGASGSAQQTQAPPRTYSRPNTSQQTTPPSQSAISGVNKPVWASWCLFWGILWSFGLYSHSSMGEAALAFGLAFGSFGLAALTYWPTLRRLLSKFGIADSREQLTWASAVLFIVLLSILGIGELERNIQKGAVQASVMPSHTSPEKSSSPVPTNQNSGASGPQVVWDDEQHKNARQPRSERSFSQVPYLEPNRGKQQPALAYRSQKTIVFGEGDIVEPAPRQGSDVTELHNEKASNRPDLSGLSQPEQQSIEAACSQAKYIEGPAAYNRCLANQLRSLHVPN